MASRLFALRRECGFGYFAWSIHSVPGSRLGELWCPKPMGTLLSVRSAIPGANREDVLRPDPLLTKFQYANDVWNST